jgi:hypothetical protein
VAEGQGPARRGVATVAGSPLSTYALIRESQNLCCVIAVRSSKPERKDEKKKIPEQSNISKLISNLNTFLCYNIIL